MALHDFIFGEGTNSRDTSSSGNEGEFWHFFWKEGKSEWCWTGHIEVLLSIFFECLHKNTKCEVCIRVSKWYAYKIWNFIVFLRYIYNFKEVLCFGLPALVFLQLISNCVGDLPMNLQYDPFLHWNSNCIIFILNIICMSVYICTYMYVFIYFSHKYIHTIWI